ncbi:MAG: bifunctional DNA primase/polymerase [Rhodopirellula sp.]|nr:bifunctional DNA primase/polymerase [Rhodopirellula sp.]
MRTSTPPSRILEDALSYHAAGLCVIPIRTGTKKPACRSWKPYQLQRPDEVMLRRWFSSGAHGIGLIMGAVAGGIVCRDFDLLEAFQRWAAAHPDLARCLPTVATARGRHVYGRLALEVIPDPGAGDGVIDYGDGELRMSGCLVVAPPSKHRSGAVYRWLIPMPASVAEVPLIDLDASGFRRRWAGVDVEKPDPDETQRTQRTQGHVGPPKGPQCPQGYSEGTQGNASNSVGGCGHVVGAVVAKCLAAIDARSAQVDQVIRTTLPTAPGQRHRQVFELCRALKSIPALRDEDPRELRSIVQKWHRLALPHISTEPFEETYIDFLRAWPRVKYPVGGGPVQAALEAARTRIPVAAADRYEQEPIRLLVALCAELQRRAAEKPFFLDCRTAGRLLEVPHGTAARWLYLLRADGFLRVVETGQRGKASSYRYIGPEAGRAAP